MIYLKIFLDQTDGENALVIEASPKEDGVFCYHAKKLYDKSGKLRFYDPHTTVGSLGGIAISPEAKAFLSSLLDSAETTLEAGDLALVAGERTSYGGWERGYFAFRPDDTTFPLRRVLKANDTITVGINGGYSKAVLDGMHLFDNERIKALDLSSPVPKDKL